jgi:hypothetical protein
MLRYQISFLNGLHNLLTSYTGFSTVEGAKMRKGDDLKIQPMIHELSPYLPNS